MTSTIKVYSADGAILHSDDYPSAWSFKALQKLARNWMKYTNGVRYTIDAGGVQYQSKTRKAVAA